MSGRFFLVSRWSWPAVTLFFALHLNAKTLHWTNGDSLPGVPVSLQEGSITWDSPIFTDKLNIDTSVIDQIDFAEKTAAKAPPEFLSVETRQGDKIYGELTALDNNTLTLTSPRFGTIQLDRSRILSLQPLQGSSSYTLQGTWKWTTLDKKFKVDRWKPTQNLGLETHLENSQIFRPFSIDEPKQYEVYLKWKDSPGFEFCVQAKDSQNFSFRLETWDDTLVLLVGKQFKPVLKFKEEQKRLALRIFHKPDNGNVIVCSNDGKLLVELRPKNLQKINEVGFFLKNKGSYLALESLNVLKWDGSKPSQGENVEKSRIVFSNGTTKQAKISSYDPEKKSLIIESSVQDEAQNQLVLSSIARIQFEAAPTTASQETARVLYSDGMFLRGELITIRDQEVKLKIPSSNQPLSLSLNGCRNIDFPTLSSDAPKSGSRLKWENGQSHGMVTSSNSDGFPLAWSPVGARKEVTLRKESKILITRLDPAPRPKATDILNLTDRTAHPVNIERITEDKIHFSASFLPGPTTLPSSKLKAVQFNNGTLGINFADKQWKLVNRNSTEKEKPLVVVEDRVQLERSMGIAHPGALSSGNFEFEVDWTGASYFSLRLDLFAEDIKSQNGSSHQFRINKSGNRVYWLDANRRSNNNVTIDANLSKTLIRIESTDENIQAFVGKQSLFKGALPNGRVGSGFALYLESISSRAKLGISSFKSGNSTLQLTRTAREQLLKLPRLLKDKPPPHILAAPNGDLLRGKLNGFTLDTATFRSRVREIQVPRERLAGVVWLNNEENQTTKGANIRLSLTHGHALYLDPTEVVDGQLKGNSPTFGECSVALDQVQVIELGNPTPEKTLPSYSDWKLAIDSDEPTPPLKGEGPYNVEFYPLNKSVLNKMIADKIPQGQRDPFDDPAARPAGKVYQEALLAYFKSAGIPMDDPDCGFAFDGRQMIITHADNIHEAIRKLLDSLE